MKRISVLPKGCIGMIGGVPFNPNLERHSKELGEHAAASTTIQASEGVNYVQNGATYTIHISAKALTAKTAYVLPSKPDFDTFLTEYVTTEDALGKQAVSIKPIALAAGVSSITLDPGTSVVVSGSYLSSLGD